MTKAEIEEFEALIQNGKRETDLQSFLEAHPEVLRFTFDSSSYYPTVFPKLSLGGEFIPDFVMIGHRSSWMWTVNLIEIEPPVLDGPMFNRKRQPTGRLRDALSQIEDWQVWMDKNKQTAFLNTALRRLKDRHAWDNEPRFYNLSDGTSQMMYIKYRIIIGRRIDFSGWGTKYQELKWTDSGIELVPWDRLAEKCNELNQRPW